MLKNIAFMNAHYSHAITLKNVDEG